MSKTAYLNIRPTIFFRLPPAFGDPWFPNVEVLDIVLSLPSVDRFILSAVSHVVFLQRHKKKKNMEVARREPLSAMFKCTNVLIFLS